MEIEKIYFRTKINVKRRNNERNVDNKNYETNLRKRHKRNNNLSDNKEVQNKVDFDNKGVQNKVNLNNKDLIGHNVERVRILEVFLVGNEVNIFEDVRTDGRAEEDGIGMRPFVLVLVDCNKDYILTTVHVLVTVYKVDDVLNFIPF